MLDFELLTQLPVMPFNIGPYTITSKLLLAPMAGITDKPYRDICRRYGAGLTVSEMISSDPSLSHTKKTQQRMIQKDEPEPRSVQIVGTDPETMAKAAVFNVAKGANIIDINMGCPAKKVCNTAAGSALMRDPVLVKKILSAVVNSVDIPITLKIRTGWDTTHKNALEIAFIAEDCGISSLAVHGRTKSQAYTGYAEFETIRQIKEAISIPVIANGDISSVADAEFILRYTNVDGLMLGRITQGQPWVISEINHALDQQTSPLKIDTIEKKNVLLEHIYAIHRHYGADQGVRIARKHIGWYLLNLVGQNIHLLKQLKKDLFSLTDAQSQYKALESILDTIDIDFD